MAALSLLVRSKAEKEERQNFSQVSVANPFLLRIAAKMNSMSLPRWFARKKNKKREQKSNFNPSEELYHRSLESLPTSRGAASALPSTARSALPHHLPPAALPRHDEILEARMNLRKTLSVPESLPDSSCQLWKPPYENMSGLNLARSARSSRHGGLH